jgi:hypothetical protein
MKRALAIAVVAVTAACGGELAPDDDGGRCEVAVQFEPLDAVAPTSIVARATVDGVQGVLTYSWLVSSSAGTIATTPRTPDNRDVEFIAAEPGVYQVELNVTGGSRTCPTWRGDKNVRDPGSTSGAVRLRFTPGPSTTGADPGARGGGARRQPTSPRACWRSIPASTCRSWSRTAPAPACRPTCG